MNLITGATGILGSHVALNLLLKSEPVSALRRPGSDMRKIRALFEYRRAERGLFERIQWIEADITDYYGLEEAVSKSTTVYHCAGLVSFDPRDRARLMAINEEGTANVVHACLQTGAALCHASSIATIRNSDLQVLDESVFWKKSGKESDYAISKYNAEREVWRGIEEGLRAVIVNPGVILAPVFWDQSSGTIFKRSARGNRFYTEGSSAYIGADDAARAMVALVEARKFGSRYIIAEGNYTFREVLGWVQQALGKKAPRIALAPAALKAIAALEGIFGIFGKKPRVLTKSLIESAFNRQKYDNSKLKNEIPLSMKPIPDVISEICGYFRTVSAGGLTSV